MKFAGYARVAPVWLVIALFLLLQTRLLYFTFTQDGIAWLFVNSRGLLDGFYLRHFWPQCHSQAMIAMPFLLIPGRAFSSLLHPAGIPQARLIACAIYFCAVVMLALVARIAQRRENGWLAPGLVIAWMSVGLLPFYMVSLRPETLMVLGLFGFILLALGEQHVRARWQRMALGAIFLLMCSWFLSMHMKAILFTPVLLICGYVVFRSVNARAAAGALVLVMMWQSYEMWQVYIACDDDRRIYDFHRQWALPFDWIVSEPRAAIPMMMSNLGQSYDYYTTLLFSSLFGEYRSWLAGWYGINLVLWIMAAVAVLAGIRQWWHEKNLRLLALMTGCIVPAMLLVVSMKMRGKTYESPFIFGIIALLMMVIWILARNVAMLKRALPALAISTMGLAIFSLSAVLFAVDYHRVPNWKMAFDNSLQVMTSLPLYESRDDVSKTISELAGTCGIALDESSKHVTFDASTYIAVRHTHAPIYGVTFEGFGPRGAELMSYLKKIGSDGLIMSCEVSQGRLKLNEFNYKDGFCCVSKKTIDSAP